MVVREKRTIGIVVWKRNANGKADIQRLEGSRPSSGGMTGRQMALLEQAARKGMRDVNLLFEKYPTLQKCTAEFTLPS